MLKGLRCVWMVFGVSGFCSECYRCHLLLRLLFVIVCKLAAGFVVEFW